MLKSADGIELRVVQSLTAGKPRVVVVLTHGRGEHLGRYGHVVEALTGVGIEVWSYDLRGHGRSGGPRGDVPSYEALLEDLERVVTLASHSGRPLFLLGHSLGGQITLNFLLTRNVACRGAIVASPYLRLAFAPPRWRLALAYAARWFWPSLTQQTSMPWSRLSRDQEHLATFPDMQLMHHDISARMYHAVRLGAVAALAGAPRFQMALLLIHGADDPVTCVAATRAFFEQAGSRDKSLKIYPGMLHETHNEIGREQVIVDVIAWIEARLDP